MSLMTIDPAAGAILKLKNLLPDLQEFANKEMAKILEFQDQNYGVLFATVTDDYYVDAPRGAEVMGFRLEGHEVRVLYKIHGYESTGKYEMVLTTTMAADRITYLQQKLDEAREKRHQIKERQAADLQALELAELRRLYRRNTPMPDEKTYDNATHHLKCKHCVGDRCKRYMMRCHVLGTTRSGKVKVLVFGRQYWSGYEHVQHIRYVEPNRVRAIPAKVSVASPGE